MILLVFEGYKLLIAYGAVGFSIKFNNIYFTLFTVLDNRDLNLPLSADRPAFVGRQVLRRLPARSVQVGVEIYNKRSFNASRACLCRQTGLPMSVMQACPEVFYGAQIKSAICSINNKYG